MTLKVGDFVHHEADAKTEHMKMLVVEDMGNDMFCCRYVHYKTLHTNPHRKFQASALVPCGSDKKVFEGIVRDFVLDCGHLDVEDETKVDCSFFNEVLRDFEDKKVRITIEELSEGAEP